MLFLLISQSFRQGNQKQFCSFSDANNHFNFLIYRISNVTLFFIHCEISNKNKSSLYFRI